MLRKIFTIATLAIVTVSGALVTTGCKSDDTREPRAYGLTGTSDENWNRHPRYLDSKGREYSGWDRQTDR